MTQALKVIQKRISKIFEVGMVLLDYFDRNSPYLNACENHQVWLGGLPLSNHNNEQEHLVEHVLCPIEVMYLNIFFPLPVVFSQEDSIAPLPCRGVWGNYLSSF